MAFNKKYKIESTSDVFGKINLFIYQDGYLGSVIELDGAGRNWITLNIGGNTQDITDVILPSNLQFQFFVKENFQTIEFGDSEPFTFLVELQKPVGSSYELIWKGWIKPEEYSESYTSTPYVAVVNCTDGLEELKVMKYENIQGKDILFNHIAKCLNETGLGLNIKESVNIYDESMTNTFLNSTSPFLQVQVENTSYFEISDDVTYYDVLVAILRPFFSRIYQYRGWNIENIDGKKSNYVERVYNANLTLLSSGIINPIVELDNSPTNFKAFLGKSGTLEFKPSINNCEVYFNTSTPNDSINIKGFANDSDWIDNNNLVDWIKVGGISISKSIVNFDGFVNSVSILGKNSSLSANQFIQSKFVSVDKNGFESLKMGFKYYMNYPSIILLGSKPIFYAEIQLFVASTNTSYFWNNGWRAERQFIRLDANGRRIWRDWEATIDEIPDSGQLRFRFHKLIKSGDTANTELRLTGFFTELQTGEKDDNLVLKETGSSAVVTDFEGAGFEHYISDGQVLDRAGVMDVFGTLTGSWSRRGKTDNLNIRRLYILQWLSMLQKPTAILAGEIYIKGENITPISVIKDKDSVRGTKYLIASYSIGLCNGIGSIKGIELPIGDVTVNYLEESVNPNRVRNLFPDFRPSGTFAPTRSIRLNAPTSGTRSSVILNGDVTGDVNTVTLNPTAIVGKEVINLTTQISSRIVLNAVEDSEDQENMTKTSVKDLFGSWAEKSTFENNDKIVIIDSEDNNELKTFKKLNLKLNFVRYDIDNQNLEYNEKENARKNINVYSKEQIKEITGYRINLNTYGKDNLVQAINETNTWTQIEW
jgi:hypothetical protein